MNGKVKLILLLILNQKLLQLFRTTTGIKIYIIYIN
nr:MAG TPA: hypothetical protein [Crassvirales sp.]